jgi:hypothetical protein
MCYYSCQKCFNFQEQRDRCGRCTLSFIGSTTVKLANALEVGPFVSAKDVCWFNILVCTWSVQWASVHSDMFVISLCVRCVFEKVIYIIVVWLEILQWNYRKDSWINIYMFKFCVEINWTVLSLLKRNWIVC